MMSVKSAREELWRALGSGDISASGFTTAGQLSTIPAEEWTYLELASDATGRDYLVFAHNPNKPIYTRVTILKTPIFSIWDGSEQLAKTCPSHRAKRGGKPGPPGRRWRKSIQRAFPPASLPRSDHRRQQSSSREGEQQGLPNHHFTRARQQVVASKFANLRQNRFGRLGVSMIRARPIMPSEAANPSGRS